MLQTTTAETHSKIKKSFELQDSNYSICVAVTAELSHPNQIVGISYFGMHVWIF